MKNSNFKLFAVVYFLFTLISIHSFAQENFKNFSVNDVKSVSVSSGINLIIRQQGNENLKVEGPRNLLSRLEVINEGGHLTIRFKQNTSWNWNFNDKGLNAYLNIKNLNSIKASGGSDVISYGILNFPLLKIAASGGADVELNVRANNLLLNASGGADIKLKGVTRNMEANASGGSDIDAKHLIAQFAKASASGGADITLNVVKALNASASGGGDISYLGDPQVSKSNNRSGDVKRIRN